MTLKIISTGLQKQLNLVSQMLRRLYLFTVFILYIYISLSFLFFSFYSNMAADCQVQIFPLVAIFVLYSLNSLLKACCTSVADIWWWRTTLNLDELTSITRIPRSSKSLTMFPAVVRQHSFTAYLCSK